MKATLQSKSSTLVSIVILLVLGFWIPSHFSFTRTKSLDHRLFYIASAKEAGPAKGSYIMFRHNHPLIDNLVREARTDRIIKKVACTAGEYLKVVGREFYCDGRVLGNAVERTPSGIRIGHFEYEGTIPENQYFVMGTSADSFDSRYFGFVDKRSIIALVYPVI